MATGRLKFFDVVKGYGFIEPEGAYGPAVFVQKANIEYDDIRVNQKVQFELTTGKKGPEAINVIQTGY